MEKFKKFISKLIYPHVAIILILVPIAVVLTVCSLIYFDSTSVISIISYVIAFYALTIVCFRIPNMINFFKKVKEDNKYIQRWVNDVHFRVNVMLYGSLLLNVAYALFQLCLGFYHMSFWFYSMAVYYIMLAFIRFYLSKHTKKYQPGEKLEIELKRYNFCGWLLLFMNIAVVIIIFFIIYWGRTFYHHEITTIALAAYTFLAFTIAIVNMVKFKKLNSPVYSATKTISLVAACVSMMTLTTTMLTTFGGEDVQETKNLLLSLVGAAVSIFILTISIYIIVTSKRKLKRLKDY
ncbi:MAG: hypothetical protein J6C46_12495 [Clostridia bacterium]|nr:hypothetical protein [Clostridia bacterium]